MKSFRIAVRASDSLYQAKGSASLLASSLDFATQELADYQIILVGPDHKFAFKPIEKLARERGWSYESFPLIDGHCSNKDRINQNVSMLKVADAALIFDDDHDVISRAMLQLAKHEQKQYLLIRYAFHPEQADDVEIKTYESLH